jgi:hypothetical protein
MLKRSQSRVLRCIVPAVLIALIATPARPAIAEEGIDDLTEPIRAILESVISGLVLGLPTVQPQAEPVDTAGESSIPAEPVVQLGADYAGDRPPGAGVAVDSSALVPDGLIPFVKIFADLPVDFFGSLRLDVKAINQSPTKLSVGVAAAPADGIPAAGALPADRRAGDFGVRVRSLDDIAIVQFVAYKPKPCYTSECSGRPVYLYPYSDNSGIQRAALETIGELVEAGWKKVALDLNNVQSTTEPVANVAVEGNRMVEAAGGRFAAVDVPLITRAAKSINVVKVSDRGSVGNNVAQTGNMWGFVSHTIPVYVEMIPRSQWITTSFPSGKERDGEIQRYFVPKVASADENRGVPPMPATVKEFCTVGEPGRNTSWFRQMQRQGFRCQDGELFHAYTKSPVTQERYRLMRLFLSP